MSWAREHECTLFSALDYGCVVTSYFSFKSLPPWLPLVNYTLELWAQINPFYPKFLGLFEEDGLVLVCFWIQTSYHSNRNELEHTSWVRGGGVSSTAYLSTREKLQTNRRKHNRWKGSVQDERLYENVVKRPLHCTERVQKALPTCTLWARQRATSRQWLTNGAYSFEGIILVIWWQLTEPGTAL